jgi:DNA uptake protein ComE-like DNA-binding protein
MLAIAGCRSAQQFAPVAARPATQSAAKPEAVKPAVVTKGARPVKESHAAKVVPVQDDQKKMTTAAVQATADTEQAAKSLITGLKENLGAAAPYPPSGEIVNINYSSEDRLVKLPGIDHVLAMKIIRNRPYATPTDLMAKHVLTQNEYDRIQSRLTAWDNLWTDPD